MLEDRAMADDPRVQQLLEEMLDLQRTPEEVCHACPEVLPQLRARWDRLVAIRAQLGALFPTPASTPTIDAAPPAREMAQVPGYEVKTVLGRGSMGVVYLAWHLRLNRAVALKMLLPGALASLDEAKRFLREAEIVAGLRHPNIVQVLDVGSHDGRPYFTMELVEGGNLAQKLSGTPLPVGEAVTLLAMLAEAMQVAHQGSVLHRNLRPANVLLTAEGTPKITDFGLARRLEGGAALTLHADMVGAPNYMAPEQARGQTSAQGPAADIYALGAILYELLTGRPPFPAESTLETIQQVLAQEPVPPGQLNVNVPRDLEAVCLKCLHKEPEQRYASAMALAEDLRRWSAARWSCLRR
jgi:serine/threonine-protein kinase